MHAVRTGKHMERETKGWTRLTDAVFLLLVGVVAYASIPFLAARDRIESMEDDTFVRDLRDDVAAGHCLHAQDAFPVRNV